MVRKSINWDFASFQKTRESCQKAPSQTAALEPRIDHEIANLECFCDSSLWSVDLGWDGRDRANPFTGLASGGDHRLSSWITFVKATQLFLSDVLPCPGVDVHLPSAKEQIVMRPFEALIKARFDFGVEVLFPCLDNGRTS
jgi:hypothetical protein